MSKLYRWKSAVYKRAAAFTPVQHIVCTGTSHTSGTTTKSVSYPSQLAALLTTAGITTTSNSWWGIKAAVVSGSPTDYDPTLTLTGTWATYGIDFGRAAAIATSSAATWVVTPTGNTDTLVVYYRLQTSGGSFNVDVGAGAIGSAVSCSGTTDVLQTVTKSATLGANTWRITTTSTSAVVIVGCYAYDSTASVFVMHNGGGSGYLAANIANSSYSGVIAQLNPAVAGIEAVTNDASSSTAVASYVTSLSAAIAALPNDKFMFTDPPSRTSGGGGPITQAAQDKYNNLARSCAWAANIPILDPYAAMSGGWTQWNAQGFYLDDYHLTTTGKGFMAMDAYNLLIAP